MFCDRARICICVAGDLELSSNIEHIVWRESAFLSISSIGAIQLPCNLSENATKAAIEREKKISSSSFVQPSCLSYAMPAMMWHHVYHNAAQAKKGKAAFFFLRRELARDRAPRKTTTHHTPTLYYAFSWALDMRIIHANRSNGNLISTGYKRGCQLVWTIPDSRWHCHYPRKKVTRALSSVGAQREFFVAVLQYFELARFGALTKQKHRYLNERDRYLYN